MPRSRSRSPPRRPREEGSSRYDRQRDSDRAERPRDADRARDNYRERSPPRRNSRSPPPAAAAAPAPRKPRELSMYKRSSGNSFASRRDPLDDMPRKTREEIERQEVPGRYGGSRGQYTGGGSYLSGAGKSDPLDSMAGRRGGDERRSDGPTPTGPRTGPNGGPPERPPAAAPSGPSAAVAYARMIEVIANDRLGRKVRVKCAPTDSVGDLKKLIAAQTGTTAGKIQLKKWYTTYKDHVTLADYEIHDGMSLEMY